MNKLPDELDHLFASARARRLDTSTQEYAFETRLLAHLREKRQSFLAQSRLIWRLIPAFSCAVLILGYSFHLATVESDQAQQLAQEQTETIPVLEGIN